MNVLGIQEEITGGESVYCINQSQMRKTRALMDGPGEDGARLRELLASLERTLDRNERAALAFTLIERLGTSGI